MLINLSTVQIVPNQSRDVLMLKWIVVVLIVSLLNIIAMLFVEMKNCIHAVRHATTI